MSSVTNHSPPSFYAVYLLRSCASSNSTKTYIGSSPDPARRKRQHNGELKGGAWKTRTGRPWETVAVVWGFGSKIAALQFEWAWQKPHLSRHLRVRLPVHFDGNVAEVGAAGSDQTSKASSSGTGSTVSVPLFPLTSRTTTAPMSNGKAHLGAGAAPARLLVLDALMLSEPFAHWGLRITFFDEWAWGAWSGLQRQPCGFSSACDLGASASTSARALAQEEDQEQEVSRGGRPLPPIPLRAVTTNFEGVDGARTCLTSLDDVQRKALKLAEGSDQQRSVAHAFPAARQSTHTNMDVRESDQTGKGKRKASAAANATSEHHKDVWSMNLPGFARLPGHWDRVLPRSATAKAVRLTWRDMYCAPRHPPFPHVVASVGGTRDVRSGCVGANPLSETSQSTSFRFNDDDLAEVALERLQHLLERLGMSLEMYVDGQAAGSQSSAKNTVHVHCSVCKEQVNLRDHLSYALCPAPMTELRPITPRWSTLSKQAVSSTHARSKHCDAVFHLPCLAQEWLGSAAQDTSSTVRTEQGCDGDGAAEKQRTFLLPTHGLCPVCSGSSRASSSSARASTEQPTEGNGESCTSRETLWSEVVKSTFRRKELAASRLAEMQKEASRAEKARMVLEAKANKKRRRGAVVEAVGNGGMDEHHEVAEEVEHAGLLARVESIAHGKGNGKKKSGSASAARTLPPTSRTVAQEGHASNRLTAGQTTEAPTMLRSDVTSQERRTDKRDHNSTREDARARPKPQPRSHSRSSSEQERLTVLPAASPVSDLPCTSTVRSDRPRRSSSFSYEPSSTSTPFAQARQSKRTISFLPALDELTNASFPAPTCRSTQAEAQAEAGMEMEVEQRADLHSNNSLLPPQGTRLEAILGKKRKFDRTVSDPSFSFGTKRQGRPATAVDIIDLT